MKPIRLLIVLALVAAFALPVLADDVVYETVYETVYVDPATLHIGNPPAGGDPNQIITSTFGVLQNSGGAGVLNNPWLLILGVPNTNAANPFGTLTVSSSSSGPGSATFLGLKGTMTAGQEAYSVLGLANDTNSNNFGNWATAEAGNPPGITATSFGLYEYNVSADLGGKDTVTFSFASLPTGTIAIAYGTTGAISTSQECKTKGKKTVCTTTVTNTVTIYDTPWTEAAFYNPPPKRPPTVPEPASLMLLGAGILGLSGLPKVRR